MQAKIRAVALALLVSASMEALAREDGEGSAVAVQKSVVTLSGGFIYIDAPGDRFRLSGPDGFSISSSDSYFDFGNDIPDGTYTFSVYKDSGKKGRFVSASENSRNSRDEDSAPGQVYKLVVSGSFKIIDNTISTEN